ncbi:MAG: hypothetical protein ACRDQZ_05825 [Mycobacteriales bacterium]
MISSMAVAWLGHRPPRAQMNILHSDGAVIGHVPAPIAVVSDNGPCFRGTVFAQVFTEHDPLLMCAEGQGRCGRQRSD